MAEKIGVYERIGMEIDAGAHLARSRSETARECCQRCGHIREVHRPDCAFGRAGGSRPCDCSAFVLKRAAL